MKTTRCAALCGIEPLEARIAPAAVFTYIDVDGDTVTVKTSKGTNTDLENIIVPFLSFEGVPNGQELQRIDFSMDALTFNGTSLTVTAKRGPLGGDGLVNVGFIDATSTNGGVSLDLGAIKISGDLGRILAGDATTTTAGVKSLTVGTMGRFGTDTQSGFMPSQDSFIIGAVGKLAVRGDVKGGSFLVSGGVMAADGKIGSVVIGGSLIGGGTGFTGFISATGEIKTVKVGQNIEGSGFTGTGQISSGGKIGSATIGGSILGGGGQHSGRLVAASFAKVLVKGSVVGSNAGGGMNQTFSGAIEAGGGEPSGSVTILGSLLGGESRGSGRIFFPLDLKSLTIGGDLRSDGLESGTIEVGNRLGSLTIRGSVVAGAASDHGANIELNVVGKIAIGGSLVGGDEAPFSAYISAINRVGSVTIGGSIIGGAAANVAATGGTGATASGSLDFLNVGKISVGGNLIGNSGLGSGGISANFDSLTVRGSLFGGAGVRSGSILSTHEVGPIVIGGDIRGGDAFGSDVAASGAIIAKSLTSVKVGGSIFAGQKLTANTLSQSGFIGAEDSIGSIIVKGSLIGNVDNSVAIFARGQAVPGATADVAIGKITIGGRVEYSLIGAGYSLIARGLNADAQIGSISVGGDWIASNVLAGINPVDGKIGTADDRELLLGENFGSGPVKDSNALTSKIASIVIRGGVFGTPGAGTDSFGFIAQEIGAFKAGSTKLVLKKGVANDVFASGSALPIGAGRSTATPDGFEVHVMEV